MIHRHQYQEFGLDASLYGINECDTRLRSRGWEPQQGRDSIAQGASALGGKVDASEKPQRGEIPFSVTQSNVEQVKAYIVNQEEHHRKVPFQDEFWALLRKHEIEFDERYVWH